MSKTSKNRRSKIRKEKRRAVKAQRRVAYAALAGTSQKKKRTQKKHRFGAGIFKHAHAVANCGNPGCGLCFPEHQIPKKRKAS